MTEERTLCCALEYLGSQAVPEGAPVHYYRWGQRQISLSLERCVPCFTHWGFRPDSRVVVAMVGGPQMDAAERGALMRQLGLDADRPVYSLPCAGRGEYCVQELPALRSRHGAAGHGAA